MERGLTDTYELAGASQEVPGSNAIEQLGFQLWCQIG
jgi:hypothetical protein